MKTRLAFAFNALFITGQLLAVSPDQTNLGILILENKINFKFINVCVSNLAPAQPPEEVTKDATTGQETRTQKKNLENIYFQELMKANQMDFNGNMWYLQSNYKLSYRQLRGAQGNLKNIFQFTLEKYKDSARILLEATAPMIIRSNDAIAKHLLKLGFRDLKNAEDFFTTGLNSAPHQYRYKLLQYSEGLKTARRARRYALLAMIAAKTPDEDKLEYKFRSLDDMKKTVVEENIKDYDRIRNTLRNYIDNKFLEEKVTSPTDPKSPPINILEVHDDNYGFITNNRLSLLEESNLAIKKDDANQRDSVPVRPDARKDDEKK